MWDSSVGMATGRLHSRVVRISSPFWGKDFSPFHVVLESIQSPIEWVWGLNRSGHESDYSPSTSAEVKNT
jgi:hypothetical protein